MALKIYFGAPGSGKTTYAAKIVSDNLKRGVKTYSNVPIKGAYLIDMSDVGVFDISGGDVIIDEAGIVYNSRAYKSLPSHVIQWFKLYRHYGVRHIYVISQSYEDMDITLRRLATELYLITRVVIPGIICIRRIAVRPDVDDNTHQIIDYYSVPSWSLRLVYGRKYWRMFNSWSCPALPCKDYLLCGDVSSDP